MAVYDYTPLYGAGDIIPGTTANILANLGIENPNVPVFELLGSANKGGNNANERMTFAAQPGQSYRLVNNITGQVLGEARTPEEISSLVAQSNALSKQLGKKADLSFEQSQPDVLGGGYSPIFQDQPNELVGGFLGNVMDVALPALASLVVPGGGLLGTILPAAGASAASSLMQERGLQETLLRAALTGAGSGLGEKFLAPALDSALRPATQAASQAGTQAVTQAGTQAVTQSAAGQAGDILVNALPSLLSRGLSTGITSLATNLLPSVFDSAQFNNVAPDQVPTPTSDEIIVNAIQNAATTTPASVAGSTAGSLLDVGGYTPPPEEIVLTAKNNSDLNLGGTVNVLTPTTTPPVTTPDVVMSPDLTVTAPTDTRVVTPFVPPITVPPGIIPPATTPTPPADTTPPAKKNDVLGTGLTLGQLLAIGGIGSEVLGSLFGGGGDTGTATPYVSPFGMGAGGLLAGRDMRVNPNITDYEKYGFGPEAVFFSPQYGVAVNPTGSVPASAIVNPNAPTYTPLI
jgi:hypothetical protein